MPTFFSSFFYLGINVFLIFLFCYFTFYILYFLFFAIAGNIIKTSVYISSDKKGKFLILIPAYKEDGIIVNTVQQALAHDYPSDKFEVAVIADKLQPTTIEKLRSMNLKLIEVQFDKSTKAKSLNFALDLLPNTYDFVLVLDADNVMGKGCMEILNAGLQAGFLAVQGHRTAKNKNTNTAILDGISEEINNRIFRIGHRAVGLSSALIGSAMAFEYSFYRKIMEGLVEVGSEDQEVELRIIKNRQRIEYVADAHTYDEKIQNEAVLAKQRTRWVAGQFAFLSKYASEGISELFKGNIDYFNKILQKLIPPRAIMLGLIPVISSILFLSSYFFGVDFIVSWWLWLSLLIIYAFSMFISIPRVLYNQSMLRAFISLPRVVFMMIIGIFGIGKAMKTNFHTPKTTIAIE